MSYLHCPYCEIKENAKIKTVYEALQPCDLFAAEKVAHSAVSISSVN